MKRTQFSLAAALLLASLSTMAASQTGGVDGFVSAAIGQGDVVIHSGSNTNHNEGIATELQASLAYTDRSGFGGQFDYTEFAQRFGQSNIDVQVADTTGHLFYRGSQGLLGVIGQHRRAGSDGDLLATSDFWGLEAQSFLSSTTLYAQAGQGVWNSFGQKQRGYFVSAEARYFLNENLRLNVAANYQDDRAIQRWTQQTYSLGAEQRLHDSPWSMFARYEYVHETWGNYDNQSRVMLGVKYNFGKASLLASDRDGSSLKSVPRVLYWGTVD